VTLASQSVARSGASADQSALRHLARQHVSARTEPRAGLIAGYPLGRLRERLAIKNEHNHPIAARIDVEQAAQELRDVDGRAAGVAQTRRPALAFGGR